MATGIGGRSSVRAAKVVVYAVGPRRELHFGQAGQRAANLLFRGQHQGLAADDFVSVLIDGDAFQPDGFLFRIFFDDPNSHADRVADFDRLAELKGLAQIDGSRSRQAHAEQGGDERAAPHAVGDDFLKAVLAGVFVVQVRGICVAGGDGEQLNVLAGQHAL